VIIVKYI